MAEATAIFAGGCFWCTEAVFDALEGVSAVESGYIGGHVANPTYKQVCGGDTGHAEAVKMSYDPAVISYADLLDIFFATHDPTQLNRQGNDVGPQYRSAVFVQNAEERAAVEAAIARAQADYPQAIVTKIEDGTQPWYVAEDYHQEYFANNGDKNPYCTLVVAPKVLKFRKRFSDKLKD